MNISQLYYSIIFGNTYVKGLNHYFIY